MELTVECVKAKTEIQFLCRLMLQNKLPEKKDLKMRPAVACGILTALIYAKLKSNHTDPKQSSKLEYGRGGGGGDFRYPFFLSKGGINPAGTKLGIDPLSLSFLAGFSRVSLYELSERGPDYL